MLNYFISHNHLILNIIKIFYSINVFFHFSSYVFSFHLLCFFVESKCIIYVYKYVSCKQKIEPFVVESIFLWWNYIFIYKSQMYIRSCFLFYFIMYLFRSSINTANKSIAINSTFSFFHSLLFSFFFGILSFYFVYKFINLLFFMSFCYKTQIK